MKRILTFTSLLLSFAAAFAQSTNPLNYSGKMYVSSYEIVKTPRYVSYADHAKMNSEMTIPVTEVTTLLADFENGTLRSGNTEYKIKVTDTKKYTLTDYSWVVVISMESTDGKARFDYVWREYGNPYLDTIMAQQDEPGTIKIIRMNLSSKPKASSIDDALFRLFEGYGGY